MPGTDAQKRFLLNCNGCHTLERIMKSTYDATASCRFPAHGRLLPRQHAAQAAAARRHCDSRRPARRRRQEDAEWLASVNLSQQQTWAYPLKTEPRLTGKSTRVIITEYDLPNP